MSARTRTGVYTGTGSGSLDIEVGFIPEKVEIYNITDGTPAVIWFDGMAAGASFDIAAQAQSNTAGSVSRFTGSATKGQGFSTGADNNVSAKEYRWVAHASA